jgi:hypothetical protein
MLRSVVLAPRLGCLAMAAVAASASVGCLIDRRPLAGTPAPVVDAHVEPDAAPERDAFVEDGVDAAMPTPDAFSPDAFSPDAVTFDGGPADAGPCDFPGDSCCAGRCTEGLRCLSNDLCDVALCGTTPGGPCCLDGTCPGSTTVCVGGPSGTCETCGGRGERRCASMSCDWPEVDACDGTRCVACGQPGQPCCAAGAPCTSPATCGEGNRCQLPEGTRGGRCRDIWTNPRCDPWSQCSVEGICEPCGLSGETCCGLGNCQAPWTCQVFSGFRCS